MTALRLRYQTVAIGDFDIHLRTLYDRQQFADDDGAAAALGIGSANWPLFGVLWDAGTVLAQLMRVEPLGGRRILEIGCGIALASLVLNRRQADITATDYHPEAGTFLRVNVALNHGRDIPFIRTGWADDGDSGLGRFDFIIGSDLLYERDHAALLSAFIDRHAQPRCEVILVDPGRGHHARFSRQMVARGYAHSQSVPEAGWLAQPFKGPVLRYVREGLPASLA